MISPSYTQREECGMWGVGMWVYQWVYHWNTWCDLLVNFYLWVYQCVYQWVYHWNMTWIFGAGLSSCAMLAQYSLINDTWLGFAWLLKITLAIAQTPSNLLSKLHSGLLSRHTQASAPEKKTLTHVRRAHLLLQQEFYTCRLYASPIGGADWVSLDPHSVHTVRGSGET